MSRLPSIRSEQNERGQLPSAVQSAVETVRAGAQGNFGTPVFLGHRPEAVELADAINELMDRAKSWYDHYLTLGKRTELLAYMSDLLSSELDLPDLAQAMTERAVGVLADCCLFFMYDEDSTRFTLSARGHKDQVLAAQLTRLLDEYPGEIAEGLPRQVASARESVLIKDAANIGRFYPDQPVYGQMRMKSILAVPVILAGRMLAVLLAFTEPDGRQLDEEDLRFAVSLAEYGGTAVERVRLREGQASSAREAQILYAIAQAIMSSLDLSERLGVIATSLADAGSAQKCILFAIEQDVWNISASHGLSDMDKRVFALAHPEPSMYPLESDTQEPLLADSRIAEHWLGHLSIMLGIGKSMIVPISPGGKTRYVAVLYAPCDDGFGPHGIRLCRTVAGLAAVAIEKGKEIAVQQSIAETLRAALVPDQSPAIHGLDIGTAYVPADPSSGLAGDFYDFLELPDGRWVIVLADVCGKGMEAASHIAMGKFVIRAYAMEDPQPGSVLTRANEALSQQMNSFISAAYVLYDPTTRTLSYCNAGHPPMVHCSWRTGQCASYSSSGPPLGALPGMRYVGLEISPAHGDKIVLVTDGITEARSHNRMFDIGGVERKLRQHITSSAQNSADALVSAAREFAGGVIKDDIAVIAIGIQ